KENLSRLINENILIRDDAPCFYLYRITMNNQSQTGLVAITSVQDYDRGLIKKHEHTRPEKVNDRANHILTLEAQVGPVFSIFRHNDDIKSLFNRLTSNPQEVDFTGEDRIRHELWVINHPDSLSALQNAFNGLDELYIADGHHRSEAASEICRRLKAKNAGHTGNELYNFFLNVIFPDNELHILPYNRVVKDMNSLSLKEIINRIENYFFIEKQSEPVIPRKNHRLGLYCNGHWYLLTARENSFDSTHPADSLDSAILTKNCLEPVLGITDIRTDKRINFIGGIRGVGELVKLVDNGDYKIAFSMFPVSVEQLLKVADAGEVMPPKSTWFEPKLRSGMVVNLLSD
ncbi:MAG: DUF1015 domain-containing protein, partial [Candidatus Zixiibacteriota bacterium]